MHHRSLLACYAHPDDETFGCGGTLARASSQGARVVLICATRGEAGEISDPALATPETLPQVREVELRNAAQALGIHSIRFLNYRDSGMDGTADNQHPDAFINAPDEDVVRALVRTIREMQPQVLLTFDPSGGYGHPDHIAINRHTVAAFNAAGDPDAFPDCGAPWQPARLFYPVIARSTFGRMREAIQARGIDVSSMAQWDGRPLGYPDEDIDLFVDVGDVAHCKWAAFNAHRTQFGPKHPFHQFPKDMVLDIYSHEAFVLALPEDGDMSGLTDVFDGL